jgi:hypothetical protein
MQRLVILELKIGDFKPADSGQLELYARTGERLLHAPEIKRISAHPQSRALLSIDGSDFVVSRLG